LNTVLFLCSGNYYRSRFAEILFNQLAGESNLDWRADSRGIVAATSHNPGPISASALQGLAARNIFVEAPRYPMQLTEHDLQHAMRIVALYEQEHRHMMREFFSTWTEMVEYWNIPDLGEMGAEQALALLEQDVRALIRELSPVTVLP
jgi:protein-tyrosine phosphatase